MEGERREKLYDHILIFKHLKIREHLEHGKKIELVKLLYERDLLSLDSHIWVKSTQGGIYL